MKTPKELKKIIEIFKDLDFVLFKCEHVFFGENKNLDILFRTSRDYKKASVRLAKLGFILHMGENIEKFKKMYVKVIDGKLYAVHLHREIAWHGLIALDKKGVFSRSKNNLPAKEDSLYIHIAHIVFENFKIKNRKLLESYVDYYKPRKISWKKEFDYVLGCVRKKKQVKNKFKFNLIKQAMFSPLSWGFFLKFLLRKLFRIIDPRRKGCLIALVGVNGAGKTTMANAAMEKYYDIATFFHGSFGYYFGWESFLPLTKLLSKQMKKKDKSVFKDLNKSKFSLKKELVFVYEYIEYLARYLFLVRPKLKRGKLVVCDRYFYDIYGQHNCKSYVMNLLMRLFPKPDYLFVLDAPVSVISKRDKDVNLFSKKTNRSSKRNVHAEEYLMNQKRRYERINRMFNGDIIDTQKNINFNVEYVISKSWRKLAKSTDL